VGNGAVVAGNAVVTKRFYGCCIIGGNPTKIIEQGNLWARDRGCTDKESVIKFLLYDSESFKANED
jgi:serine acetyltransferase